MSKDEHIDKVLSLENFENDINLKFLELNDYFNGFDDKYETVNSNLSISRHCNELLLERITQSECNSLNNVQYNRGETLELTPVLPDIAGNVLERSVCQALSLTRIAVEPGNLQACHRFKKKDQIIAKFKCRKQNHRVLFNHKVYKIKVSISQN